MALIDTLQKKYGKDFHPAMLLAGVVHDEDEDLKLRVDCAKSLMPYVAHTHKAVEVRGQIDHRVGLLRVSLFEPNNVIDVEENAEIEA